MSEPRIGWRDVVGPTIRYWAWLWLLVAAAAVWSGGEGLWVRVRERQPLRIAAADVVAGRPGRRWLTLTDCRLNLLEATTILQGNRIIRMWVPIEADRAIDGQIHLVLVTEDPTLLDLRQRVEDAERPSQFALRLRHRLTPRGPIEGLAPAWLARVGWRWPDDFAGQLSPTALRIDHQARPPTLAPSLQLLAGLAMLASLWWARRRLRKPTSV